MPAHAQSWYHEKESAWLYGAVAAAETDPARRELFLKLAAAAEEQAACWRRTDPSIPEHFSPKLRARVVALLLRRVPPRNLRPVLAAMKLRGLSVYSSPRLPASHPLPVQSYVCAFREPFLNHHRRCIPLRDTGPCHQRSNP